MDLFANPVINFIKTFLRKFCRKDQKANSFIIAKLFFNLGNGLSFQSVFTPEIT